MDSISLYFIILSTAAIIVGLTLRKR